MIKYLIGATLAKQNRVYITEKTGESNQILLTMTDQKLYCFWFLTELSILNSANILKQKIKKIANY